MIIDEKEFKEKLTGFYEQLFFDGTIPRVDVDFGEQRNLHYPPTIKTNFYAIHDTYKEYRKMVEEVEEVFSVEPKVITGQFFDIYDFEKLLITLTFAAADGYNPHAIKTKENIWSIAFHRPKKMGGD